MEQEETVQGLNAEKKKKLAEKIQQGKRDVFNEIESLPGFSGKRPGRMIVFGENTVPLLASDNEHTKVVLAVAEYGEGRAVFVSQAAWLRNIEKGPVPDNLVQFQKNVKLWVSNDKFESEQQIVNIDTVHSFAEIDKLTTKIMVWKGGSKAKCDKIEKDVLMFVKNGGGFIYGINPKLWMENNPEESIDKIPFINILKQFGVYFADDRIFPGQTVKTADTDVEKASNSLAGNHLGYYLVECLDMDKLDAKTFKNRLQNIPKPALQEMNSKLQMIFKECSKILHDQKNIPTFDKPVQDKSIREAIGICGFLSKLSIGFNKVPGIDEFPGDFKSPSELDCMDMEFSAKWHEVFPTGFYLPAGQKAKVTVVKAEGSPKKDWSIQVGAHTDKLYDKAQLKRWPDVVMREECASKFTIFSPFGGSIYVSSPKRENVESRIKLRIDGVVESPIFDITSERSVSNWNGRRQAKGLWADVSGKFITFTMPSSSVRHFDKDKLTEVLELWDKIVTYQHDLRGTDPTLCRKTWFASDADTKIGSMHAGWPIMTHLNVADKHSPKFLLNKVGLQKVKGFWGPVHEMGHNMQRNMWTFEGTREVTCNIFTMYIMDVIGNIKPLDNERFGRINLDTFAMYLREGANYMEWRERPTLALAIYAQLASEFGWDAYKKVLRSYETEDTKKSKHDWSDEKKIDEWIKRFSNTVCYDLCPMFSFWGIPISEVMQEELKTLVPFLPDDFLTELAPERMVELKLRYPLLVRQTSPGGRLIGQVGGMVNKSCTIL